MCTLKNTLKLALWSRCSIVVPIFSYKMPLLRHMLQISHPSSRYNAYSALAYFWKHLTVLTLCTGNPTNNTSLEVSIRSIFLSSALPKFNCFPSLFVHLFFSLPSYRKTWLLLHDPSHSNCFSAPHHLHSVLSGEQYELLFFKQELLIWVPPFTPQLYPIACNVEGWVCQSYGGANMGEVLAGIISCVTIVTSPPTSPQTLPKPPSH